MFGPFVDKTDGVTLEVGAGIITSIDHATTGIFLSKAGGTAAIRHQTVTASVLDAYGMFKVTLDTTDTNTVGTLDVLMAEAATFLPVHKTFMILPANVFDSLMGTDLLDISMVQIGGVAQSATDLKDLADTGYDPATHKVAGVVLADGCTANTDMRGTDSAALASVCTEARLAELAAANLPTDVAAVKTDTAAILLDTGTDGVVLPQAQADKVWGTAARALTDKVDFALSTAGILAIWHQLTANIVTASTIGKLLKDNVNAPIGTVDTVVDGIQTDLSNATDGLGALKALIDAITVYVDLIDDATNGLAAIKAEVEGLAGAAMRGTDNAALASAWTAALATALGNYTAARAGYLDELAAANIPANVDALTAALAVVDGIVDDILVDTAVIGALGAGLTAIPWNAAWDAEVESEVNDALNTAISELSQAVPTATPTLRTAIMLLYMAVRNKLTTTATELGVYNDAGTKISKKALSDDGTTYTEGEMASGA